jgi:hypothetical protein
MFQHSYGAEVMSAHQYRITLEYMGGKHHGSELHAPLHFEVGNHDDLFNIVKNVQEAQLFDADTSAALVLGMKLFSEVMLKHRKDPIFSPMADAYKDYIGIFKQKIKEAHQEKEENRLTNEKTSYVKSVIRVTLLFSAVRKENCL